MISALLVRSAWIVAPATVIGPVDPAADWNGLAVAAAPVAAAEGLVDSGVVVDTGASDAVAGESSCLRS
jgi:hypothetical protein